MVPVPNPLTVKYCGPVVQPSVKLLAETVTGLLKVTTMSAGAEALPPFAGVVPLIASGGGGALLGIRQA